MIRRPPKSTLFPYPPLFRSLHVAGLFRPPYRLAQPSQGLARLAARGGDVEGGGLDAPLSHQGAGGDALHLPADRKSTRLNSSHLVISYAVFCLKKKKTNQ